MFLCSILFTGNAAPYRITEPSTNNDVQIVSPNATMTSITCSLNVTIPSTVIVTWSHNTSLITDRSQITTAGSTTTLLIGDLQSSDAGVYQCVFNDTAGSGRALRRNIRLIIIGKYSTVHETKLRGVGRGYRYLSFYGLCWELNCVEHINAKTGINGVVSAGGMYIIGTQFPWRNYIPIE